MSVERPAAIEVRNNVWEGASHPLIAGERIEEGHCIAGCTFEVKEAVLEAASAKADRSAA